MISPRRNRRRQRTARPEICQQRFECESRAIAVVAYDFGIKQNILRLFVDHGCDVTVVPAKTSAEDVLALKPDGVFLSNGPGDPEPITYAIENIRKLARPCARSSASASAISSAAWRSAATRSS